MRYDYMYMLERLEFIAGYGDFSQPCVGCIDLNQRKRAVGDYSAHHYIEPNKSKPIYLTIVNYKRDTLGEKITPEFYCQNCANKKINEIRNKLINFSITEARTTALIRAKGEWEEHWRQSEEEKKLEPSKLTWLKK